MNTVLYSSKCMTWETPKDLFMSLHNIFHFDLDVAASKENALCEKYYTEEANALVQEWRGMCWCNPPYGR